MSEEVPHGGISAILCPVDVVSAPLSAVAPQHDLTLWYDLQSYVQFDRDIARAALSSVRRHLWYLCPFL